MKLNLLAVLTALQTIKTIKSFTVGSSQPNEYYDGVRNQVIPTYVFAQISNKNLNRNVNMTSNNLALDTMPTMEYYTADDDGSENDYTI